MKTTRPVYFRLAAIPALLILAASGLHAQTPVKPMAESKPMAAPMAQAVDQRYMRASQMIGKNVRGADDKNIGEINDLVVDVSTGDIRYVMFEYDPSIFKTGKVYAVPLKDLTLAADGKSLGYKTLSRDKLDRVATDKTGWKAALANTRYLDSVDTAYGVQPRGGNPNLQRASDLIGKDVNSRAGKDIGDITELVVDMQTSKVRYAVLAFDPSIFSAEKMFAFPMTSFKPGRDRDELMLDVDRERLAAMKSFDKKSWAVTADMRSIEVNNAP